MLELGTQLESCLRYRMCDLNVSTSPGSTDMGMDEADYEAAEDDLLMDDSEIRDRDLDEALSEVESDDDTSKDDFAGIKEEMYQDKLAQLKNQLQQLRNGTHPEYNKKLKKIEAAFKERLRMNDIWRESEMESIENDFLVEQRFCGKEFEERKKELKENLIAELEEKKRIIEQERHTLDLASDSLEYKPVSTRKLRRRGNEPPPLVEKRRKPISATSLQLLLEEKDVEEDLRQINKSKLITVKKSQPAPGSPEPNGNEPRIENGKLYFDKKWFHKGQPVMMECKDGTKFNGVLALLGMDVIVVRRVPDGIRFKITLGQLAHGKYLVRRRNC